LLGKSVREKKHGLQLKIRKKRIPTRSQKKPPVWSKESGASQDVEAALPGSETGGGRSKGGMRLSGTNPKRRDEEPGDLAL